MKAFHDLCVLVVEDELLVAVDLRSLLSKFGVKVAGLAPNANVALRIAQENKLDGAIVDVNLNGRMSFDLADTLVEWGIPLVFATGYDRSILPERFHRFPCIDKPILPNELLRAMQRAFLFESAHR